MLGLHIDRVHLGGLCSQQALHDGLVGFHVHEYTQYFLHSVQRIVGLEQHLGQIAVREELRRADTFPLGVDFEKFERLAASEPVGRRRAEIADELGQHKVVLSVDRLDYTKGIESRLRGYELFLERFPEWHGKVVFVPLVVPSRVEVREYVNKGAAAAALALDHQPEFVLALGDDQTDEDLFRSLPPGAYTVHVGAGAPFTAARFNLAEQRNVRPLLRALLQE